MGKLSDKTNFSKEVKILVSQYQHCLRFLFAPAILMFMLCLVGLLLLTFAYKLLLCLFRLLLVRALPEFFCFSSRANLMLRFSLLVTAVVEWRCLVAGAGSGAAVTTASSPASELARDDSAGEESPGSGGRAWDRLPGAGVEVSPSRTQSSGLGALTTPVSDLVSGAWVSSPQM